MTQHGVEECWERLDELLAWPRSFSLPSQRAAVRALLLAGFDLGAQLATGGDLCTERYCPVSICQTIRLERARLEALGRPAKEGEERE